MQLVGARGQITASPLYDFSGTVTTGGTAQLVLPRHQSRSYLLVQNTSSANLLFTFGSNTATPTVTNQAVASIAVGNAGMGYSFARQVMIMGGGLAEGR